MWVWEHDDTKLEWGDFILGDGGRGRGCGHGSGRGMVGEHAPFKGHGRGGFGFADQKYNDYLQGYGRGRCCGMYEDFDMLDRDSLSRKRLAFVEETKRKFIVSKEVPSKVAHIVGQFEDGENKGWNNEMMNSTPGKVRQQKMYEEG